MMRARRGFTLWETSLVLAVLVITLVLAAPAMVKFGQEKPQTSASGLLKLLHDAREMAITTGTTVNMRLDPLTGRFRIDTIGTVGAGTLASGTLALEGAETLVTDLPRLGYIFRPTGAAFGDTVLVRAAAGTVLVRVDPWSGVARADSR